MKIKFISVANEEAEKVFLVVLSICYTMAGICYTMAGNIAQWHFASRQLLICLDVK